MEHNDTGLAVFIKNNNQDAGVYNQKLKQKIGFNFKWAN